jgi:hypothetical protein
MTKPAFCGSTRIVPLWLSTMRLTIGSPNRSLAVVENMDRKCGDRGFRNSRACFDGNHPVFAVTRMSRSSAFPEAHSAQDSTTFDAAIRDPRTMCSRSHTHIDPTLLRGQWLNKERIPSSSVFTEICFEKGDRLPK